MTPPRISFAVRDRDHAHQARSQSSCQVPNGAAKDVHRYAILL